MVKLVEQVTVPAGLSGRSVHDPIGVPFEERDTVPDGAPPPDVTVTVRVTESPGAAEVVLADRDVEVEAGFGGGGDATVKVCCTWLAAL